MALVAAIWAIVRLRNPILKALGIAALVTAVVYVFTPLTAAGAWGNLTVSSPTRATCFPESCWR